MISSRPFSYSRKSLDRAIFLYIFIQPRSQGVLTSYADHEAEWTEVEVEQRTHSGDEIDLYTHGSIEWR